MNFTTVVVFKRPRSEKRHYLVTNSQIIQLFTQRKVFVTHDKNIFYLPCHSIGFFLTRNRNHLWIYGMRWRHWLPYWSNSVGLCNPHHYFKNARKCSKLMLKWCNNFPLNPYILESVNIVDIISSFLAIPGVKCYSCVESLK